MMCFFYYDGHIRHVCKYWNSISPYNLGLGSETQCEWSISSTFEDLLPWIGGRCLQILSPLSLLLASYYGSRIREWHACGIYTHQRIHLLRFSKLLLWNCHMNSMFQNHFLIENAPILNIVLNSFCTYFIYSFSWWILLSNWESLQCLPDKTTDDIREVTAPCNS